MATLKNIDLRLLECLDALIRECSVTLAAERLHMSQGNMSNSLARLRELLGDPLLVRTSRGMRLTDRARDLQEENRSLIRRMRALLEFDANRDIAMVHRSIRLACTDATALVALGPLIEDVRQIAPNLQIEVSPILNLQVAEPLAEGLIDLAIGSYVQLSDALQVSRLLSYRMMCVVSANGALAGGAVDLELYCDAPHAVFAVSDGFRSTTETIIDQALTSLGRTRSVRLTSQFVTMIAEAVSRSDLVAAMPDFMLRHFSDHLPLAGCPMPFDLPDYGLSVVWHNRARSDWVLAWFRQQLRRHLNRKSLPLPAADADQK